MAFRTSAAAQGRTLPPSASTLQMTCLSFPPSFEAPGLVPFNINPHYIDPLPDSNHMG
ncbi:UNVERIFIED_CONTAM: hypothetical protein GTU68_003294 [Idotea baltica]|nr:hypothetical protein [Idotea baltica]